MRVNPWHITIICVFLITTFVFWTFFYVAHNLEEEQARSNDYDTVWSATNGRNEFYKYSASVSRYLLLGKAEDFDDASIKFDILMGRVQTWNSGVFRKFLDGRPELTEPFGNVMADLQTLDGYMQDLTPEKAGEVQVLLNKISKGIEIIAGKSYVSSVDRITSERRQFQESLKTEKKIVMGLLVFATCLLAVVMLQNWNLTQANAHIAGDAERLAYLAKHDSLTTLPNRTLVDEYLAVVRGSMKQDEILFAVALDLDGFKAVNDTLGHNGGDALLTAVSARLAAFVQAKPGSNLAARVGGDEFLLLFNIRQGSIDPDRVIGELQGEFTRPLETPIGSLLVGASIGFASAFSRKEIDYVVLNADLALTDAKSRMRGTSMGFLPPMRTSFERRLQIERELPKALENGQIQPFYQMQFNVMTGEPVGMEALARWTDSGIGCVSPGEFIPVAEASGDILVLGRQVLNAACRDIQSLPGELPVSVNLSMIQLLNDNVVDVVTAALETSGLHPGRLTIEVTESVVMKNIQAVTRTLSDIQSLGVSISLDDFGTGYSSLSYLGNFRWDELKIDRSFVASCETSSKTLNIVNVIKMLADKLNAKLMIEGLETRKQVDIFRDLGCHFGQGYYYSRPASLEELYALHFKETRRSLPVLG